MDLALTMALLLGMLTLGYTFLGYPLLVYLLGKSRSQPNAPQGSPKHVSVVLVARNESNRIAARIHNILETEHPNEKMEVVVVSDGSDDGMPEKISELKPPNVRLIEAKSHRGKPSCLNDGVAASSGEIIVFADARQRFTKSTIPNLIAGFSDPAIGAISGELHIEASKSGVGRGVDAYWKLERMIRLGESRIDSSIGCTGAIYAIRKASYTPLPPDTILDDVVCPMQIALSGKQVKFEPTAVAFDPQPLAPASESRRKRRTLAGNFQMFFRYPSWLLPWKNRLFIQLISHKYFRLLAPVVLVQVLVTSLALALRGSMIGTFSFGAQSLLYLVAALGIALPNLNLKMFTIPAGFVFLNAMTVRGFVNYLLTKGKGTGW